MDGTRVSGKPGGQHDRVPVSTCRAILSSSPRPKKTKGKDRFEAAVTACRLRLRLRPILMTAFSFILGVVPLLIATGAGFEMRRVLGTTVFSGMLGVTVFGLFLTPVFYVVLRGLSKNTSAVLPAICSGCGRTGAGP